MGVAVSGWKLARAVSEQGQLGVVSGIALAVLLAHRLQNGDPDGDIRHALKQFPFPEMANRVLSEYFIDGGKAPEKPFKRTPMPTLPLSPEFVELTVVANFVEVFLAKAGHPGVVGINYLEKIQVPTLPSLYGAMLAGVDYVLMGAGIPRSIPGVLDRFAEGAPAELRLDVAGAAGDEVFHSTFSPRTFCGNDAPRLKRPQFFGIISSASLAMTLARKSNGQVDGFVVEGHTAGGHNAAPRGEMQLNADGEPIYGPRDVPELEKIRALGLPFWLAGSFGRPGKLAEALALGASGIQVGTAFAFCEESGIPQRMKEDVLHLSRRRLARVCTDPLASPTGFPIKVARLDETLSEAGIYAARQRVCDLGYLRHLYRTSNGTIGYRCPAEPLEAYVSKGGAKEDTEGRKCLCNGLLETVGLGQVRPGGLREPAFVTAGDDLTMISSFLQPGAHSYSAADVIAGLLSDE